MPDQQKIDLLSAALAVLVPPLDEDYGYVTLEAMLSARAVITCTDSGGPLEFIEHGATGLVCEPDPAALADAHGHVCGPTALRPAGWAPQRWSGTARSG